MRNFLQIGQLDPLPLLHAIAAQPQLWSKDMMVLRWPESEANYLLVENKIEWAALPQARDIVMTTLARVAGVHLGKVWVERLVAGDKRCLYNESENHYFSHYIACLQALPGVEWAIAEEKGFMPPGTGWWLNSTIPINITNNSADDLIYLGINIHVGGL